MRLTPREIEVMNLLAVGMPSKEIAENLEKSTGECVSKRTVDFHLSRIYPKLGVTNRVQAVNKWRETTAV